MVPTAGFLAEELRIAFAHRVDQVRRQVVGGVELAGEEGAGFGVGVFDRVEADRLQPDGAGVPVVRVALDLDVVVEAPLARGWKGPLPTMLGVRSTAVKRSLMARVGDHVAGDREPGVVAGHRGQEGDGFAQARVRA